MTFFLDTQKQLFTDFVIANPGCNICYDGNVATVTLPPEPPVEEYEQLSLL